MQATPSSGPSPLISRLAKPSSAYKRQAWLAVAGLLLFLVLYFALALWFALTAYRLTFGAGPGARDVFWGWLVGACAAFLSVFMLKAVLFVKHGGNANQMEIRLEQQPELFRFLHELARQAGAPKPHKVFVSAQVNAAVFYDLSILNLLLPSRKNLEIGLGLVNVLTLGEFRAVVAHEFGHFAQRAMAVGRWVYIAQQIAAHLIARRDKLDAFLVGLSGFDLRVAWVGWLLRLVVWSIRSLVDSVFQLVLLMQRSLSREMELNADLVAVSVTGSDALIHALYKLEAADDAWGRAASFAVSERSQGRLTPDLFDIQTRVVAHMGRLLGEPGYGQVPPPGTEEAAQRRLFRAEIAQPPQMWLSHPLNNEREANAKRVYVEAPIDQRPAWDLFNQPQALREEVTARFLAPAPDGAQRIDDAPARLQRLYEREFLDGRYRGIYFGRPAARWAATRGELYGPSGGLTLDTLYPESLAGDMENLRSLEKEKQQLEGLQRGTVTPPGGVIRHRGQTLQRKDLLGAIGQVGQDVAAVHARLQAHDRACRSLHLAAAQALGEGWPDYLLGLAAALHYGEHVEADLRDLQGLLANTVAVATATRKVREAGVQRILRDGNALRDALVEVYGQASALKLGEPLAQRLGVTSWSAGLGQLGLPGLVKENAGEWLNAVSGWVNHVADACGALRSAALEQLLQAEAQLSAHAQGGPYPGPALQATDVPQRHATLLPGGERQRQTQLDWWDRFQTADGLAPAAARVAVAGGIVVAVLGLGGTVGTTEVTTYNGLARTVVVRIGHAPPFNLPPLGTHTQPVEAEGNVVIETRSGEGALIERFSVDAQGSFGRFVYNVAGATPLVEWTAVYGNLPPVPDRPLGAPRWSSSGVAHLFEQPPKSISSKGGGTRNALAALGDLPPGQQLDMLRDPKEALRVASAHMRWDAVDSAALPQWLWAARLAPDFDALLRGRLAESPDDVLLLRMELDAADAAEVAVATGATGTSQHQAVCARHLAAAAASPSNVNLAYARARCLPEGPEKDRAFAQGYASHPDHGWFAYAAANSAAALGQWDEALVAAERARSRVPALRDAMAVVMARILRLQDRNQSSEWNRLTQASPSLRQLLSFETGQGLRTPLARAYAELAQGRIDAALELSRSNPAAQPRLLRLAAASDRASPALVAQAQALPLDQGMDDNTLWAAVALKARAGQDLRAFEPLAQRLAAPPAAALLRFAQALKQGLQPTQAERLLAGLTPEYRGYGYSIGCIMLGASAPQAWRDGAKRLLFAPERPYFN